MNETVYGNDQVAVMEPIGYIGLGAMGAPMVRHLVSRGYRVLVNDISPEAVQAAVLAGAHSRDSPQAIASEATLVLVCLPSLDALREVAFGSSGVSAGTAIKTFVDLSTTGAAFAREMSRDLRKHGIQMLDAPVTGGVTTAGNGDLGVMCSGGESAYRHAQPVLATLASKGVFYLGDCAGRAQTLKLLNNLLSATGMAVSCEAMILGTKAGLDPMKMLEVINGEDSSSSASRNKFPKAILTRQFDYGARMAITAKDISLTLSEAEELGVPMWIARSVQQLWRYAVSQGGGSKDGTALITYLEPWAGIEVRANPVRAPETSSTETEPSREFVLLCDARDRERLTRLVGNAGWKVTFQRAQDKGQPESSPGSVARDRGNCILVPAEPSAGVEKLVRPVLDALGESRTLVNACPMSAAKAAALARAVQAGGHGYVDILQIGTMDQNESGTGSVLVGGQPADVDCVLSLINQLGSTVHRVSHRAGDAHLMKQLTGSLFATLFAVTTEAFVTGAKAGLTPAAMTQVMGIETGRNAASAHIMPSIVATRQFNYGRRLADLHNDLIDVCDTADDLGVTAWVMEKARLLYGLSTRHAGPDDDVTRLVLLYEGWAGIEVANTPDSPAPGTNNQRVSQ